MTRLPKLRGLVAISVALTAAIAVGVGGCTAPGAPASTSVDFAGQWVLVTGSDSNGALPLDGTYITLTVDEDDAASGRGPCSDYHAKIIGRPGPIFVSVTGRQIAMCTDSQSPRLDSRYLTALRASSLGTVEDEYLTLSSPKTTLMFHRVQHFMIGGIVDVHWNARNETVVGSNGFSVRYPNPAGGLTLRRDKTFRMSVGACPVVTGRWAADAGEIVLGRLANAAAACTTPDDSQNRTDVMAALTEGFQISLLDGTLVTTNPRNHRFISFRAGAST